VTLRRSAVTRWVRAANRLLLAGAASVALLAVAGGCSHTSAVGPSRTLHLALTEYRVVPQSVVAEPGDLTLIVDNDGRLTHNLTITIGGTVVGETPPIMPGASSELLLNLSRGTYLMASTMFSDQALGAYGTLRVGS
jgi:hypothetical protein